MSRADLDQVYLTIGTRHRLEERKAQQDFTEGEANKRRPILGEKGLGRLSVMRLSYSLATQTRNFDATRTGANLVFAECIRAGR